MHVLVGGGVRVVIYLWCYMQIISAPCASIYGIFIAHVISVGSRHAQGGQHEALIIPPKQEACRLSCS